jgi:serine/threonine protein kinase
MSPERLLGNDYFSDTDLWALGITIVELAWGKMPFGGLGYWELTNNITSGAAP